MDYAQLPKGPFEVITDYGPDTPEESYIKERLAEIERRYRAEVQPWRDQLVKLHLLKLPKIFVVPKAN